MRQSRVVPSWMLGRVNVRVGSGSPLAWRSSSSPSSDMVAMPRTGPTEQREAGGGSRWTSEQEPPRLTLCQHHYITTKYVLRKREAWRIQRKLNRVMVVGGKKLGYGGLLQQTHETPAGLETIDSWSKCKPGVWSYPDIVGHHQLHFRLQIILAGNDGIGSDVCAKT